MMRFYDVTLIKTNGDERIVRVPSRTDVQAADAAVGLAHPGEAIGAVVEVEDDGTQQADGLPAGTQTHPDWTA